MGGLNGNVEVVVQCSGGKVGGKVVGKWET